MSLDLRVQLRQMALELAFAHCAQDTQTKRNQSNSTDDLSRDLTFVMNLIGRHPQGTTNGQQHSYDERGSDENRKREREGGEIRKERLPAKTEGR
jgi:hypothetical protein